MSGEIEYGKCEICGKETQLERTYFIILFIASAAEARIKMGKSNILKW